MPTSLSRLLRQVRLLAETAALACVIAAGVFVLRTTSGLLLRMELATLDARCRWREARPPDPHIVLVTIDEASLQALGPFPWARSRYALLLDRLHQAGARAIVFDVLFTEPSTAGEDRLFARALTLSGRALLAGRMSGERGVAADGLWQYANFRGPTPELAQAAAGSGAVNLSPDPDGVYRRANLLARAGDAVVPHLMLEAARLARDVPDYQVHRRPDGATRFGPTTIPTNRAARLLIDFAGGPGTYPHVSFARVISGSVPPEQFAGRIVVVGATAAGLEAPLACPYGPFLSAQETLANLLENLLNDRYLRLLSPGWTLVLALLLALATALPLAGAPLRLSLPWALLVPFIYAGICFRLFAQRGLVCELVAPLGATLVASVLTLTVRLLLVEREQGRLRRQFQVYVPPHILEAVVEEPELLQLGGARREVTVLFADIRGFTRLAEQLQPEQVVDFLNDYFSVMTEVVFRFEGMVDKFVGDEIMAVFNVPLIQGDHALRAVKAALQMQERLKGLHRQWMREGKPLLAVGIGIETGLVIAGNIGSDRRMDYSVIGDPVNIAARLEDLSGELQADILVGEGAYRRVSDAVRAEYTGEISLRGRRQPVKAYRLLGLRDE